MDEIYSRNFLFMSEATQEKLNNIKLLVAGVGLGSQICHLAVRTGITNFIIADGDTVSLSNLNRQFYTQKNIGKNKARELAKELKKINPKVKVQVIPKFLDKKSLEKYIPQVDVVINTIDFDSSAFLDCSALCRKFNKLELFPTNLGFGGSVVSFKGSDPTFSSHYKETDFGKLKGNILEFLISSANQDYLSKAFEVYCQTKPKSEPQNGISTFLTAVLTVKIIIDFVNDEELKKFPKFYFLNA